MGRRGAIRLKAEPGGRVVPVDCDGNKVNRVLKEAHLVEFQLTVLLIAGAVVQLGAPSEPED
jgi:hypothetical protein